MSGDEQPNQRTSDSVGEQLRQGRERLGLDVSAIADEQHLRPVVIQAIESGDYSKIDSELFLKGYVRAYARQVGLNADAVIADLDRELEPARQQKELEHQANPLVSIERAKRRKRQVAKVLLVLVVIAIAAYFIAGYLAERDSAALTAPEPATEEVPEMVAPEAGSTVTGPETDSEQEKESLIQPADAADRPIPVDQPTESTATNVPSNAIEPALVSAPAEAVPEDLPEDQVPTVTQVTEPALQESAQLPVATDSTQARLQISFSDDCWIQVMDAGGNRLASSLRRSGDQLDVSGEAPLRVVVGAVSAVESIRFQGEDLNMGDLRVVNNRSEFTLEL